MFKLVILSAFVAVAAAEADPITQYAGGLPYGAAFQGFAGAYPAGAYAAGPAYAGYAAAPAYVAAPAAPAVPAEYAASLPAPAKIALPQLPVALPADYATGPAHVVHPVPADAYPRASPGLGLPEASLYALPAPRQIPQAPIIETIAEPVEQWGYKVAY